MARSNYRGGTSRRAPKDINRRIKKKPCALCRDGVDWVDYKDVPLLRKYMSDRGKIRSRRVTGNCAQHQRDIAEAIKTARELVLLPYTQRTVTERPGARGGRGERGERGERGDRGDRGDRGERSERGPGGRDGERGREERAGAGAGATGAEASGEGPELEEDEPLQAGAVADGSATESATHGAAEPEPEPATAGDER
jgi:small subunit ribosomal protein S18